MAIVNGGHLLRRQRSLLGTPAYRVPPALSSIASVFWDGADRLRTVDFTPLGCGLPAGSLRAFMLGHSWLGEPPRLLPFDGEAPDLPDATRHPIQRSTRALRACVDHGELAGPYPFRDLRNNIVHRGSMSATTSGAGVCNFPPRAPPLSALTQPDSVRFQ